jgi:hypothetical protein
MAHIEKREASTGLGIRTRSGPCSRARSRARLTGSASFARLTPRECGDGGSTRATQTRHWPCGLRSSCCCAGACHRPLKRPTEGTSRSTSCPVSVRTGSDSSPRTRSRTGSTTRSRRAWRHRRYIGTTAPCVGCCRWPCRNRRSSPTRVHVVGAVPAGVHSRSAPTTWSYAKMCRYPSSSTRCP